MHARPAALRTLAVLVALAALAWDAEAQQKRGGGRGKAPPDAEGFGPAGKGKQERNEEQHEFLPGFDSPPGAKKGKPGAKPGARKPKPAGKPEAPKPPDPMEAADEVTAVADHRARVEQAEQAFLDEHFRLCDLDGSGWISLREAEVTLSFDRDEYRRTDADQDGRVDAREFDAQRDWILARLGALPAAEPEAEEGGGAPADAANAQPAAPERRRGALAEKPAALLQRLDADGSKTVDAAELAGVVAELGRGPSAAQMLDLLDRDRSGVLEAAELLPLAWLVSKGAEPEAAVASATEPAPDADAAAPAAPSTHFARLDHDDDGAIGEDDLRALQSPTWLDLRLKAVLSALDGDGDGALSEREFHAAMRVERASRDGRPARP